jgi:trimethylamine--corrinoid protein Co-methyltransferase
LEVYVHIAGHPYQVLSTPEIELIHRNALRILAEMGMEIQNQKLLADLADFGLPVDFDQERVRFPESVVEQFIATADKYDWEAHRPTVHATAGLYHGLFHDPATGKLLPWTEERMAYYFALARYLAHIDGVSMLGCRLPVPAPLEPLYERYYCWKHGAKPGSSIYLDETCPYLYELYQIRADSQGLPIEEVFDGTVYLVPALKLGRHEAYQVQYFRERGLQVGIGDMYAMGGSAPITLAGAVTLNWAEHLALQILDLAWFGVRHFHLGCSISAMDIKTMIYPFGRPEMTLTNVVSAQIARHFGASFSGHAGLTDSKLPSVESGAQKAMSAAVTLMVGGSVWIDAGLLAMDEVYSPIQMILDNELLSALKHYTTDFEVSQDSIGLETIFETGPGGGYLDKVHTVQYMRKERWQPEIWSRQMLQSWLAGGSKLDVDLAREIALQVSENMEPYQGLNQAEENHILELVEKARIDLGC